MLSSDQRSPPPPADMGRYVVTQPRRACAQEQQRRLSPVEIHPTPHHQRACGSHSGGSSPLPPLTFTSAPSHLCSQAPVQGGCKAAQPPCAGQHTAQGSGKQLCKRQRLDKREGVEGAPVAGAAEPSPSGAVWQQLGQGNAKGAELQGRQRLGEEGEKEERMVRAYVGVRSALVCLHVSVCGSLRACACLGYVCMCACVHACVHLNMGAWRTPCGCVGVTMLLQCLHTSFVSAPHTASVSLHLILCTLPVCVPHHHDQAALRAQEG